MFSFKMIMPTYDSAQLFLSYNKATLGHAVLSNGVHGQMEYNEHL